MAELSRSRPSAKRDGDPLLVVQKLSVTLAGKRLVDDVGFELEQGELLGIVGESGSGKTMLGRALMGLLPLGARVGGVAWLDGRELLVAGSTRLAKRRGRELAMVFQDPTLSLDPLMRVGEQIAEGPRFNLKWSRAQAKKRCDELLERVGLDAAVARCYPHQLSGGMQQRVMIAIALSCQPKLLIADEPTTALDAMLEGQLLGLLRELCVELELAVMLISHDLPTVARLCGRLLVMHRGRVVEQGDAQTVLAQARHEATRALAEADRYLPSLLEPSAESEPQ
jgi:ABC-type glutathione transport system ATPase component